ncbi:MAG: hypothetical protein P1P88_15910 [Bacteroidales bacterium]|nr:hypothetical protein [Bacteroidales bacterium]
MKYLKISLILLFILNVACNDKSGSSPSKFPVVISVNLLPDWAFEDDWIHLKMENTDANKIVYDSLATVTLDNGFVDTIMLSPGNYQCIVDMGALVAMPEIKINNKKIATYGYPEVEAYVFSVP